MFSKNSMHPITIIFVLTLALLMSACSSTAPSTPAPSESEAEAGVSICELTSASAGEIVEIQGQIQVFEQAQDPGYYARLAQGSCPVSMFIPQPVWDGFAPDQQAAWQLGADLLVSGRLRDFEGELIVEVRSFENSSAQVISDDGGEGGQVELTGPWWLQPQTYYIAEGPDVDLVPEMNITVLHDWGSLFYGSDDPGSYWSYDSIEERWADAHDQDMRVEAVISILDIWFIEVGPDHELYPYSGIDLNGDPIQYEDPPAFVGCTNQHGWQDYLRSRMMQAVDMGADGFIIDDQEGTSRWVSGTPSGMAGLYNGPGGCFCDQCEAGFREYLAEHYSPEELQALGVEDIDSFDYSEYLTERGWTIEALGDESRKFEGWQHPLPEITAPLYEEYYHFQEQEVLAFLDELEGEIRAYARDNYGKEISWSVVMSAVNYGTHPFIPYFDRNVAGIFTFGYPPAGTESYQYRLGYEMFDAPRIREVPRDPVLVAVVNQYHPDNLLLIKNAVAYASQGAWNESGYFVEEGADEDEIQSSFHIDSELKADYNTFYLDNAELFDFENTSSLADVGVVYASASIHYDLNAHINSFYGICEILDDLHLQYDPLVAGDGLALEDQLTLESLQNYGMVFVPQAIALTDQQVQALLDYTSAGGTLVALGDFGLLDEHGQSASRTELASLISQPTTTYGEGAIYHLYTPAYSADGIIDEETHDPAAAYYRYYIENNHPLVEEFLYLIEEQPQPHIRAATAQAIRDEIGAIVDEHLAIRIIEDIFSENILTQVYIQTGENNRLILHLINLNYDLETDSMQDQTDLSISMALPDGFEVSSVRVLTPDGEEQLEVDFSIEDKTIQFTVPWLHIWDVIVIE
jgi:hypothetical protein